MSTGSIVFDRAVEYYDQTRGFPPGVEDQVAVLFERAGKLTRESRILEVGIGTGRIALPLARRVHSITGVDLSRGMMGRLRAKQNGERINLAEGDITRLPVAGQRFDAAVAVHIFHLVPGWQQALAETARALRPGGVLLNGRNKRNANLPGLSEVFDTALPLEKLRPVGVREPETQDYMRLAGWTEVSEPFFCHFAVETTPQQYLDFIERRIWSRLWSLSDADHAKVVSAVKDAIAANYDDPAQPIIDESHFEIRVFRPPQP